MNKNIGELVQKEMDCRTYAPNDCVVSNTLVGVEVELENVANDIPNNDRGQLKYWNVIEDGSLRDYGMEFVFRDPLSGHDLVSALSELESFILNNNIKPQISDRTSVHVHIDVRDLTTKQYLLFTSLYLIFERVLFKYCGDDRAKSLYCVPYYKAQGDLDKMKRLSYRDDDETVRAINESNKYSACNIRATIKYGSIEFRAHKGVWHSEELLRWINILLLMRNAAIDMVDKFDIDNLPSTISGMGVDIFFKDVFKNKTGVLEYLGMENDIYKGIRVAQEVIHHHRVYAVHDEIPSTEEKDTDRFFMYMKKKYPKTYQKMCDGGGAVPVKIKPLLRKDLTVGGILPQPHPGQGRLAERNVLLNGVIRLLRRDIDNL